MEFLVDMVTTVPDGTRLAARHGDATNSAPERPRWR
jgi:hypothetical protein